jgi:hypothetical protein
MIPNQQLSTIAASSDFLSPDNEEVNRLESKELGGVAISDPSQGLQVKTWTARYNGTSITVEAEDVPPITVITEPEIKEVSLSFDQNMNLAIAWTQVADGENVGRFYWFDTDANIYQITNYPGTRDLRVSMDDKRPMSVAQSDVILTYIKGNSLYFRAQRDRYMIEYLLKSRVTGRLRRFGMNNGLRMQWEIMPAPRDYTVKVPADASINVSADDTLTIEPEPIYTLPVTRRDPCGEC